MDENNITTKENVKMYKIIKYLKEELQDIPIVNKQNNLDTLEYVVQIVEIYYSKYWGKKGAIKKQIVYNVLNFCDINFLNKHLFIALSRICRNKILNVIKRRQLKKTSLLL